MIYKQLQTAHTLCTKPFSRTSSSVKSSQSADRSVRMSCKQDSFCQTSLQGFMAHGSHSPTEHCHRDIIKLTSKLVSNKTQPTINHHPSKYIQQSQFWFQQLLPSCKYRHYKCTSTHSEKELPRPTLHALFQWHREYYPSKGQKAYNLSLEDAYLWVVFTCASVTQFPLDTRSLPISIKLIIYIR